MTKNHYVEGEIAFNHPCSACIKGFGKLPVAGDLVKTINQQKGFASRKWKSN